MELPRSAGDREGDRLTWNDDRWRGCIDPVVGADIFQALGHDVCLGASKCWTGNGLERLFDEVVKHPSVDTFCSRRREPGRQAADCGFTRMVDRHGG